MKIKLILFAAILMLLTTILGVGKYLGINQKQGETAQAAQTFTPDPSSPLGKGEHPRLHITQDTLSYFQEKVATDYKNEYQEFVNWVDSNFDIDEDGKGGIMAEYHALIYILGPISGINYPRDISEYSQRAIEIMMNKVTAGPPTFGEKAYNYTGDGFAKMARAYDWMWGQLTIEQKTSIANWLADAGISILNGSTKGLSHGQITGLWSSSYFEAWHPWYYGLAFYGDAIRDEDAQILVDSFETLNLNGKWLDAQNWVAREQGGVSEIAGYGLYHPVRHVIQIDGWRTATGEDYFAQGTSIANAYFIQYYPQYILYLIKPFGQIDATRPGGIDWKLIKVGQMSAGGDLEGDPSLLLVALGESLKSINPDMAALNRWLLQNRVSEKVGDPWTAEYYYPFYFLWGDRTVSAKSPQELGLPLSQYFEGLGMAIMRTGFDSLDDTAVLVLAPNYQLAGHSWGSWIAIPAGFTIDKYGPLAIKLQGYLRGGINRKNIMRFTDPLTTADGGFKGSIGSALDVQDYTPGSKYDIGGMRRRIFETDYDYLYMDYTKYYIPERVSNYTRQFVYLRPEINTDSDYIIIFDRTETTRPDIIKRWEVSMAYNPQINGQETLARDGKWEYSQADQIIISNNVSPDPYSGEDYGGHGRLFIKKLLPQDANIVKVGGPGHEFENDAGQWVGDSDMHYLEDVGAFYTGTYYTDVVALQDNTKENFLHVLQTADADFVSQMTPVARVDGDTMVGAYIQDDVQGHKVAMFSKTEENQIQVSYSITSSQLINHLIADLEPGTYNIYQDGKQIDTASTSQAGTIYFSSDGGGTFQITQGAPNQPPTVTISADPTTGPAPLFVNFTATASDPDGTIASYSWDFGDGGTSTEQNPSYTYNNPGAYTAKVEVTDDLGAKASDTAEITVTEAPKPNITLTKSALVNGEPATEASSGDIITYTITYQNTGEGDARNVIITDPIPEGTTYQTGSAEFTSGQTGTIDDISSTIKWTIPSVPAGEGGSVEFEVRVE